MYQAETTHPLNRAETTHLWNWAETTRPSWAETTHPGNRAETTRAETTWPNGNRTETTRIPCALVEVSTYFTLMVYLFLRYTRTTDNNR